MELNFVAFPETCQLLTLVMNIRLIYGNNQELSEELANERTKTI
jgi:hypothetical protein